MSKNGRPTRHRGVSKLAPGKFLIRYKTVDPKTGRVKDERRRVEAKNADAALVLRLDLMKGRRPEGEKPDATKQVLTVGEVAEAWIRKKTEALRKDGASRLTPATRGRYQRSVAKFIVPYLGEYRLSALTPTDIAEWRDHLGRTYASSTVNAHLRVLRTLLWEQANSDVARHVRALDQDDTRITEEEPNRLTADELRRLLDACKALHPQHYPLTLFLATTAPRISTALAVRWMDLDRETMIVTFRQRISDGHLVPGVKRSRRSVDRVPLAEEVLAVLDDHRARFSEAEFESGLIFPSKSGGLRSRSHLNYPLQRWLERAEIGKRFSVHGFRRTAERLYREVGGQSVAKAIAGHLTDAMHEHYAGVPDEEKLEAARRVLRLVHGGT